MNILVSTFGTSWSILPELLAFTNPAEFPLYRQHKDAPEFKRWREKYDIRPVQKVWVITTDGEGLLAGRKNLQQWQQAVMPQLIIKFFSYQGLHDLSSALQCRQMRDLIFRTVFQAHAEADADQVILSLAGGRKTMSADMQEAGNVFGYQALLHVVDNGNLPPELFRPQAEFLTGELPANIINCLSPLVIAGKRAPSPAIFAQPALQAVNFPVSSTCSDQPRTDLADAIESLNLNASSLLCNFITRINQAEGSSFYSLYGLHPNRLNELRNYRLGQNPERQEQELAWLGKLPKAELHCHLGGILSPAEIIQVAQQSQPELSSHWQKQPALLAWQKKILAWVKEQNSPPLLDLLNNKNTLRQAIPNVPEPFCLVAFVLAFQEQQEYFKELLYQKYPNENYFRAIGINNYEHLGDIQGSGLLQNEASIRAACHILKNQCRKENITYLELRCSPINYTRGGLSGEEVTEILLQELKNCQETYFNLLFIASRHGKMSDVFRQIELTEKLFQNNALAADFRERFVGFDLAGAENSRSPRELREAFNPLHKRCLNITIHAGETAPAESVWEAVYFLNADRIGHGLTLKDNDDLMKLALNRRLAIEMCPSSNFQICGFADTSLPDTAALPAYPLAEYLRQGLRVAICTDNPGISQTSLSQEYLKAARLSPKGLSQWDVLRLCKNAFQASFAPFSVRRQILRQAEDNLIKILAKYEC